MLDMMMEIKNDLMGLLNTSAFTSDSIEGVVVLLLSLLLVYSLIIKVGPFTDWLIGFIFMIQIGYWLSFTGLNRMIPLNMIFKYDVLTAVAQCFVGTGFCDMLLYINAFIRMICRGLWDAIKGLPYGELVKIFRS
jgi:hypothetical protein